MQELNELQLLSAEEKQETGAEPADAGQETQTQETQAQETGERATRPSWQDILEDSEYKAQFDAQVQSIIQRRLRGRQDAENRLQRLSPVLSALERRYCTDDGGIEAMDAEALAALILEGESPEQRELKRQRAMAHLDGLTAQAAALRDSFPDFELLRELENPEFIRLTAPHTGLSLEDAYYALHRKEINEATARDSLRAVTRAVSAGSIRPRELAGGQAATTQTDDPRTMSRQQREALKKRIYDAKAQGIKLPYGG